MPVTSRLVQAAFQAHFGGNLTLYLEQAESPSVKVVPSEITKNCSFPTPPVLFLSLFIFLLAPFLLPLLLFSLHTLPLSFFCTPFVFRLPHSLHQLVLRLTC